MTFEYQATYNTAYRAEPGPYLDSHDEHSAYQLNTVDINDASAPFVSETKGFSLETFPTTSSGCKPSIGWLTPLLIIGCFVGATAIAIANYIYFDKIGGRNGRPIKDTGISQERNNAITQVFARAFSITLATSASPAFAQLLWWYLRRKALPVEKIEALFQLNFGPFNLCQLGILKVVPLLWFFGLLFPLIPIATIFPPGCLVVEQLPWPKTSMASIPTLDVDYRGNGSASDFFKYAKFSTMPDGEYKMPSLEYSTIGKRSLLEGSYLTQSSPCGVNCSYDLEFAAPSLQCQDADPTTIAQQYFNTSLEDIFSGGGFYRSDHFHFREYNDQYELVILWSGNGGLLQNTSTQALSCVAMAAMYSAHVNYTNSIQAVSVDILDEVPLNATALFASSLFYDVLHATDGPSGMQYTDHANNYSTDKLNDLYHGCQLLSIVETLTEPLKGDAVSLGTDGYNRSSSLIQEMPLTTPVYSESSKGFTYMDYNLSPDILRDLMTNISLSVFNAATHRTSVPVTTTVYAPSYVFKSPARLIAAYAAALAVTAVFLLLGLAALLQNGVAATPGGFVQILCTTTHGEGRLNQLARQACVGGREGVPKELLELKVRFGDVVGGKGDVAILAFGTEGETGVLVKGRAHGGI